MNKFGLGTDTYDKDDGKI